MREKRLQIQSFTFGPFATNTYIFSDEKGNTLLVDPACYNVSEQQILQNCIQPSNLQILATHGHLDHLWGAAWACRQWHTKVLIFDADIPMVEKMQEQYDFFGIRATAHSFPIEPLSRENAPLHAQLLHTPGHTPGSVCLYWEEEKILLSGDTLFNGGYGRTDLPGGNMQQLLQSLDILWRLPSGTQVFPGHGDTTMITHR